MFLGTGTLYFPKLLPKYNRYLLLFRPLNTCSMVSIFLCSETCSVLLIGERECSTELRFHQAG